MHTKNIKYAKELSRRILSRMEKLHISMYELSKRTGIGYTGIWNYCYSYIIPKADKIVLLARGLEMTTDELINFEA